ncbi:TrfA protein [Trinickia symbiotica]|uniref:plasmid replication initiator TrfA n=1 Tax=Trinickia symbiotica TaxID=863227 RepID=UPI000D480210|nr:plasmid replication initiator TrfA [Trinickia symbiotica]PPK41023.1 TrfA protein [Trinickia symbiotica]
MRATKKPMHKPLQDALDTLTSRRRAAPPKKEPATPAPQMTLDLWPDAVRGVPNAVLRGALFCVSQRRAWADRELLAAVDGIEIRFKGQRFNQTDLDLWEMLVHLARTQPLGSRLDFTAHSMLQALGRGTGKTQHEQLHAELVRLKAGAVEITWTGEKKSFVGGLIGNVYRDHETNRYVVILDQRMMTLYADGYSYVDWGQRQALGTNSLAKWLHGFYTSHASPYPYKVDTIRSLCGSSTKALWEFRRLLKNALDELVRIGAIRRWHINDQDLVHVIRVPSVAQTRHLGKRS